MYHWCKLYNSENKLNIHCAFRVLPTLVGMLNTLNSWPNAIEWGRLILLALLDFSNEHEFSVSVLCRDSTELKLPEMFLWACLMDRKKRAEAWRIKPNFWLPFSASSSIHAPNKPEIEQMSDSIYSFCLVKSWMSNHTESNNLSTVYPTTKETANYWQKYLEICEIISCSTQQVPNKLNVLHLSFKPHISPSRPPIL